jgi:CheY-like chemotaxis protein
MTNKTVLVVDDDEDLREAICEALRDEGYPVACAADGAQALEWLRAHPEDQPGIILLDLMMPVMNGWQFRAEQRRDPRLAKIRTAVMTAATATDDKVLSADWFLTKPVPLAQLLELVHAACDEPVASSQ